MAPIEKLSVPELLFSLLYEFRKKKRDRKKKKRRNFLEAILRSSKCDAGWLLSVQALIVSCVSSFVQLLFVGAPAIFRCGVDERKGGK